MMCLDPGAPVLHATRDDDVLFTRHEIPFQDKNDRLAATLLEAFHYQRVTDHICMYATSSFNRIRTGSKIWT